MNRSKLTTYSWWISPLFAHRAGIIDSSNSEGGIVCGADAAYAVVMTGSDEISAPDGETIQYRARSNDPGRYRLTAASPSSRHPVRILRSHRLNSLWKPRAGVRYDGLYEIAAGFPQYCYDSPLSISSSAKAAYGRYKITGWSLKTNFTSKETEYIVKFQRLPHQTGFEQVLERPWAEELEDYMEYKRIRDVEHMKRKERHDSGPRPRSTGFL